MDNISSLQAYIDKRMEEQRLDYRERIKAVEEDMVKKEAFAEVKSDVSWLKRFFWIVATASVGSLAANIFNLMQG